MVKNVTTSVFINNTSFSHLTELMDLDELPDITEVDNHLAIFCMATYGEGDPTDNAQDFYDWLQRGETRLDGLRYAVSSCNY